VITDFDLQPNTYSDEQFAKDVIESLGKDSGTEILATDGAYVSDGRGKIQNHYQ